MKRDLLRKKTIRQVLAVLVSIMMLTSVQRGWAQNPQSGNDPGVQSSATTPNDLQTTAALRSSSVQTANIPNVMLTKGSTTLLTKTGDTGISISPDSLVKIHNPTEGTTSDPVGWNTAFNQIQPGEKIHLYQNVTLTNTVHVLPAEDCTIDGNGYELHYTQNGVEKTLVLDADITFKNIKLFDGLIAWGHKVVFESDITLSGNYSVWGGEYRSEGHTINGREDYIIENTHITIKSGAFSNIYGGSSDGEITGSTYVKIEGGTFNDIYGGNSHADAKAIPGNTEVAISGGTFNGNVFGACLRGSVQGTANLSISDNAVFNGHVFGGSSAEEATVKDINVNISGGTFYLGSNNWVYGGSNLAPVTGTITMLISRGTFNGFLACGGNDVKATAQNTSLTITGGTFKKWVYGGGGNGPVTETAKTNISGGTFAGSICGGGLNATATCGNTDMILSNVSLGNNTWVYGGGEEGGVTDLAKVTVKSGIINKTVYGGAGGWNTGTACGNTEVVVEGGTIGWVYGGGNAGNVTETAKVNISGGTVVNNVYGGGWSGNVTGNVSVTIEKGTIPQVLGTNTYVGGNVDILIKGGTINTVGTSVMTDGTLITGKRNITITGGTVTQYIKTGQGGPNNYKECTLTIQNTGSESAPFLLPHVFGISNIVLDNSIVKPREPEVLNGQTLIYGFVLGGDNHPITISGDGTLLGKNIPVSVISTNAYPRNVPLIIADNLPETTTFAGYKTAVDLPITYLPAYKAGNTYRIPADNNTLHTVNIQTPDAIIETLAVKWDETVLENGDQIPDGTELTVTTTTTGNTLTVKNNGTPVENGALTVTADVNITVSIDGGLDLTSQTTDITISKTGDQWQYLTSDLKSTGLTDFNGIVTGTLPNNKTILIDGAAKGELTFDNAKVDAGSTGTAITIASGADIEIKGSLEAKTSDSTAPAIANNGSITTTTGTNITAINSGNNTKGISVSDGATLLLTDGSTLTASGIDNATGGTVVARKGSTVNNSTSGGSDLLKTHSVTITPPDNGNTLTVKAGNITIVSSDKVTENTSLTLTATSAANYSLEKITVTPENGNTTDIANNAGYTMGTAAISIAASFKYNPPYIPPVTSYYTVTLPSVEGATFSKKAGDHTVEEGYSFTFTITLDEGYSESVPIVTTDRGETITPDISGRYEIGNVTEDIVVSISGIVKNLPTDIEAVETDTKIWAANGTLFIRTSSPQQVQVVNLAGCTVLYRKIPAGDTQLEGLAAGIYIIRLSEKTVQKIVL